MTKRRYPRRPPPPAESASSRPWLPLAAIGLGGALAYANSLPGILFWDAEVLILDNVFLRSFRYLGKIFTTSEMAGGGQINNYYRPVPVTLLLFQYQLWGPSPAGYHAFNVLMHVANACLLFLLVRRISGSLAGSTTLSAGPSDDGARPLFENAAPLVAALLFAVHPVHNETVNYVGHLNSLSTFFFGMTALNLHARGKTLLSLPAWALCLLSKEEGVIFFLILGLYELIRPWEGTEKGPKEDPLKGPGERTAKEAPITQAGGFAQQAAQRLRGLLRLWPHALLLGTYLVLHVTVFNFLKLPISQYGAQRGAYADLPLRLLTFAKAFSVYLGLFLAPVGLHFDRDMEPVASLLDPQAWMLLGVDVSVLLALAWLARRSRPALFGLGWFLVGFLPYCGLVPFNNILAEHFLYLPSAGLFLALCAAGSRTLEGRGKGLRPWAAAAGAGFLLFFLAQNWFRNRDWQDASRLYRTTLAGNPKSFRAANNLGAEHYRRGDMAAAKEAFLASLRVNPVYAPALNNAGAVEEAAGRFQEALEWYRRSAAADPAYALAHKNTAGTLLRLGDWAGAEASASAALGLYGQYVDAWNILGASSFRQGKVKEAAAAFERSAALQPSPQSYSNLALAYEALGRRPEALEARRRAAAFK